jgi:hypothetical protein
MSADMKAYYQRKKKLAPATKTTKATAELIGAIEKAIALFSKRTA